MRDCLKGEILFAAAVFCKYGSAAPTCSKMSQQIGSLTCLVNGDISWHIQDSRPKHVLDGGWTSLNHPLKQTCLFTELCPVSWLSKTKE